MVMPYASTQIPRLSLLAVCALALMSCQTIRDAAGLGKQQPDEFAVVTKAPLIMPPDYNLRPPRDGAPPTTLVVPTDVAQSALFSSDPSVAAKQITGDYSDAEKLLLVQARATNPDPAIRQRIAADGRAMEASDDSFTSQVLFWQGPKADTGSPVDADAEAKRIEAQKAAGKDAVKKPPADSATINDDSSDHGWLDGIF